MAKVTSKLQVTLPKGLADQYGVRPGDEIEFVAAGDVIRVLPPGQRRPHSSRETRLKLFDQATVRQRRRQALAPRIRRPRVRGWSREDLYSRGSSR